VITHRSPENYDPITWVGRVPVYATTIIVALYVVSMVGVAIALASGAGGALGKLTFNTESVLRGGELWRCLTYAFVNPPDLWFLISLVMLYIFGRDVEQYLGRKGFVRLYLGFLLLGPSLLLAASLVTSQSLSLTQSWANFAVFLAFAALYPSAQLLFQITAKLFALVLLGLSVLQLLAYYAIRQGSALNLDFVARLRPVTHRTKSPRLRLVKNPDDEPVDPHRIIDPLLEKISKDGLASLTRREREQLEHARAVLLEQERR
jgi:membrane associated rhomboid family serine protease